MRRFYFLLLLISSLSLSRAFAADIGLMAAVGARTNSANTDVTGAGFKDQISFDGGILGVVPVTGQLGFRSGFLVTQRYGQLSPTNVGTVKIQFMYVDVPLTLMFLPTPTVGIFAGPVLAMNVVKDCSASAAGGSMCTNVKSVAVPLTLGIQARIYNQIGAEIFYEYTSGDLSDHVSNYTSVGGNVLFYFD